MEKKQGNLFAKDAREEKGKDLFKVAFCLAKEEGHTRS